MSLLVTLILPLALWLVFCVALRADTYSMDQGNHRGSFWPLMIMYSVFFYALAFVAFVGAGVEFYAEMFWNPSVLFVAACEGMLFNLVLVFWYESYMHFTATHPEHSNYARWKYAATLSLGLSAVLTFTMGLAMTAVSFAVNKVL